MSESKVARSKRIPHDKVLAVITDGEAMLRTHGAQAIPLGINVPLADLLEILRELRDWREAGEPPPEQPAAQPPSETP